MRRSRTFGFTLAELLIALAILGEIATLTIPKILSSQQNSQYRSAAKEVAAMFSSAYQLYQLDNTVTTATGVKDLEPFAKVRRQYSNQPGGKAHVYCFNRCGMGGNQLLFAA